MTGGDALHLPRLGLVQVMSPSIGHWFLFISLKGPNSLTCPSHRIQNQTHVEDREPEPD